MAPRRQQERSTAAPAATGPDLYAELGLARDASVDDIKRAYRRLALQCHPDKCPGDEAANERFQRISTAYTVLSDPQKRRFYDQTGTTEGLDISPDEFMDMFQSLLLEIIGGADMIRDMLSCFTPRELARLPPFPFPKELFPPGTFPPGLRFSSKGLKGLPLEVEELIQSGDLHSMFAAMSGGGEGGGPATTARGVSRISSRAADSTSTRPHASRAAGSAGGVGARSRAQPRPRGPFGGYGGRSGAIAAELAAASMLGLFGRAGYGDGEDDDEDDGSDLWDSGSDGGGGSSGSSAWTDVSEGEMEEVLGQQQQQQQQQNQDATLPAAAGPTPPPSGTNDGGASSGASTAPCRGPLPPSQSLPPSSSSSPSVEQPQSRSHPHSQPQPPQPLSGRSPPLALVREWLTAARSCDVATLERLLDQEPALLGCQGSGLGHTALHWCAAKGSVEGVGWLLGRGADVNVRNDDGATPLHAAARNGRLGVVEALIAWRPPTVVTSTTTTGAGALEVTKRAAPAPPSAAPSGPSSCYQPGADVPALSWGTACGGGAGASGTAPSRARSASAGCGPGVRVCDLGAVDGSGCTALQLALQFQHTEVAATLSRAAQEAAAAAVAGGEGRIAAAAAAAAGREGTADADGDAEDRAPAALPAIEVVAAVPALTAAVGVVEAAAAASFQPGAAHQERGLGAARGPPLGAPKEAAAAAAPAVYLGTAEGDGEAATATATGIAAATECSTGARCGRGSGSGGGAGGVGTVPDCPDESDSRLQQPVPDPQRQQQQPDATGACGTGASASHSSNPGHAAASRADGGGGGDAPAAGRRPAGGGGLSAAEKAARRAALLAADAAAEREEARKEAEKAAQAEAAAAAAGLRSRAEGRNWLEAARRGDLGALRRMLADNPRLLGYQGQGTNFAFTLHTALHWAVAKGHTAAARWLLQQGADPDVPNAAGATPLHAAAAQRSDECARLLVLEAAARLGVADSLGETVRDILTRREAEESGGGGGGSGLRLASELELLARVAALRDAPGGSAEWSPRAMRGLLVAAGVNAAGLLERQELVAACGQVIARYPPRIGLVAGNIAHHPDCATATAAGGAAAAAAVPSAAAGAAAGDVDSGGAASFPSDRCGAAAVAAAAADPPSAQASATEARRPGAAGGPRGEATAAAASTSEAADGGGGGTASTAASDAAKQRGNEAFSRGDHPRAVSHYTMALRLRTEPNAVLYSNRSAAYCGMSYYGKAQADAEEAIRLDPRQPKYRCRLGVALLGQLQLREAEAAFRGALQLDPTYAAAVQGLQDVRAGAASRGGGS